VERAGAEVARRGFKGLKTNIFRFDGPEPYVHMPGFNGPGWPELNISRDLVDGLVAQMTAFRNGAGPHVGLHLDLNFNFKTEGYIRLAQALSHDPKVLVLDEPLNGLDPLARSEMIALFRSTAEQGCYVIISSHVLHEVDVISDQVILLSNGYVVAEGQIQNVRSEIQEHPTQILVRCSRPREVAAKMLEYGHTIEVSIHKDEGGLLVKTRDADRFYLALNDLAVGGIEIESIAPADDDVLSVYEYLIGNEEAVR